MTNIPDLTWDAVFCFAVLHHIPGRSQREQLCSQIRKIVRNGSSIWVSVWQPLNSQRLSKRIFDWAVVDIPSEEVDDGDVLMDWRGQETKNETQAFRYVHIFNEDELLFLADTCGFSVKEQFYSDGKEGNLGLYQCWEANK